MGHQHKYACFRSQISLLSVPEYRISPNSETNTKRYPTVFLKAPTSFTCKFKKS